MIRKNSRILIIGILAFAAAIYFLFFNERGVNQGSEGLSRFKVETIRGEHGWGYHIRQDTTLLIEQSVIPGVPGSNGFSSQEEAAKTAELVKHKLDQGIFPPTVSVQELDSMGIKYK